MATNKAAVGKTTAVPFPGSILKPGAVDDEYVTLIKQRINALGCRPVPENGLFDKEGTGRAVKLFQARFPDVIGMPLEIDGEVGSLTGGALIGAGTVPSQVDPPSALTATALEFAISQSGVREVPLGSDRGPHVDKYLEAAGVDTSQGCIAWRVAFTHFCYLKSSDQVGAAKSPRQDCRRAGITGISLSRGPKSLLHGPLPIRDWSDRMHFSSSIWGMDWVIPVWWWGPMDRRLITIEGNTNENGSRNGIGVLRREARKIAQIDKGFIDYGPPV